MMQDLSSATPVTGSAGSQRKRFRGALALGFLILSTAMSYGIVFVLIDKWYKGGSLGLL